MILPRAVTSVAAVTAFLVARGRALGLREVGERGGGRGEPEGEPGDPEAVERGDVEVAPELLVGDGTPAGDVNFAAAAHDASPAAPALRITSRVWRK